MNEPDYDEDILRHWRDRVDFRREFRSLLDHHRIFDRKMRRRLSEQESFNRRKSNSIESITL